MFSWFFIGFSKVFEHLIEILLFFVFFFFSFSSLGEVWADILWLGGRLGGCLDGWMDPSLPSSSLPPLFNPFTLYTCSSNCKSWSGWGGQLVYMLFTCSSNYKSCSACGGQLVYMLFTCFSNYKSWFG